jgi:hypothetical protein
MWRGSFPRPISAGIQPELDLKLLDRIHTKVRKNVDPPISGPLMSAPSGLKCLSFRLISFTLLWFSINDKS